MSLDGEPLVEVDCFQYQGSQVATDGGYERDLVHRMNEGHKIVGSTKKCAKEQRVVDKCEEMSM